MPRTRLRDLLHDRLEEHAEEIVRCFLASARDGDWCADEFDLSTLSLEEIRYVDALVGQACPIKVLGKGSLGCPGDEVDDLERRFLDGLQLDRLGFAGGVFWIAMLAIGAAVYAAGTTFLGTAVHIDNAHVDVGVVRTARDIYWTAVSAGAAGGAVLVLSSGLRARMRALRWLQIIVAVAILGFGAQEGSTDRGISTMLTVSLALTTHLSLRSSRGGISRVLSSSGITPHVSQRTRPASSSASTGTSTL